MGHTIQYRKDGLVVVHHNEIKYGLANLASTAWSPSSVCNGPLINTNYGCSRTGRALYQMYDIEAGTMGGKGKESAESMGLVQNSSERRCWRRREIFFKNMEAVRGWDTIDEKEEAKERDSYAGGV